MSDIFRKCASVVHPSSVALLGSAFHAAAAGLAVAEGWGCGYVAAYAATAVMQAAIAGMLYDA